MTPSLANCANRFGPDAFTVQATRTGVPVVWVKREQLLEVVDFLKKLPKPYVMLFDLHGMDERRARTAGSPCCGFFRFLPPDLNRPQYGYHAQGGIV